jgi:hypothetical protein
MVREEGRGKREERRGRGKREERRGKEFGFSFFVLRSSFFVLRLKRGGKRV